MPSFSSNHLDVVGDLDITKKVHCLYDVSDLVYMVFQCKSVCVFTGSGAWDIVPYRVGSLLFLL